MKIIETQNYVGSLKVTNSLEVKNKFKENSNLGDITSGSNYNHYLEPNATTMITLKNRIEDTINYNPTGNIYVKPLNEQPEFEVTSIRANLISMKVELDSSEYTIPQSNGIQDITITAIAGKLLSIKIVSSTASGALKDIIGLPSSLSFNNNTASINGIPFILGTHNARGILNNGSEINIRISILTNDLATVL